MKILPGVLYVCEMWSCALMDEQREREREREDI
jgi:hypothetical protein